jgi:hypothetical protein
MNSSDQKVMKIERNMDTEKNERERESELKWETK